MHKYSARYKAPLPPGTRSQARDYLENMNYLKRKGHDADDPIHIDIPDEGIVSFILFKKFYS